MSDTGPKRPRNNGAPLRLSLRRKSSVVNNNSSNMSIFNSIVSEGRIDIKKLETLTKEDINAIRSDGSAEGGYSTILIYYISHYDPEEKVVEKLIKLGANIHLCETKSGECPKRGRVDIGNAMTWAMTKGYANIVRILATHGGSDLGHMDSMIQHLEPDLQERIRSAYSWHKKNHKEGHKEGHKVHSGHSGHTSHRGGKGTRKRKTRNVKYFTKLS